MSPASPRAVTRRALFRPDARAGHGHLARCLALATAWARSGGDVVVSAPGIDHRWRSRYEDVGATWASDGDAGFEWCVLDGYGNDLPVQRPARAVCEHLLVIDDHASLGSYDADLVLDHNIGAGDAYPPGARCLLGPRYLLLPPGFGDHVTRAGSGKTALLAPGGAPSAGTVAAFESAADALMAAGAQVSWLRGVDDVAGAMAAADVAIAAAGVTAYELCRVGVPSVLVAVADNQEPVGRGLADAAAAIYVGRLEEADGQLLASDALTLLEDADVSASMVIRQRRLIDGSGAGRVVSAMRSFDLTFRDADADDAELTWHWANDAAVRLQSFDTEPIAWEAHQAWFARHLADPRASYLIAELDGRPIGNVRFRHDVDGTSATLGYLLGPDHRGRGLAAPMLVGATEHYLRRRPGIDVEALVKPGNTASARALDSAAFEPMGEVDGALRFVVRARP